MKRKIMLVAVAVILSVVSYCRIHHSEDLNALLLENVEALANDEEFTYMSCISYGSVTCPITNVKVKYVNVLYNL